MNPKDYSDIVYNVIGAAMKVHSELNWGLLEPLYTEALHMELEECGIPNEMEAHLPCYYKDKQMKKSYQPDLSVEGIIIELKSTSDLIPAHRAQLFNYMRLTKSPIGLLINFGRKSLQGERYAYLEETNECVLLDRNMNMLYPADSEPDTDDYWRFMEEEQSYINNHS
ncbi:MAG: GxxExxY protein [Bacteroidaceae bacterium]|nr:GxxExxY protein [Bacteroidaceae bacterium]MBR1683419.1 GxxExxY protein [Bacteroidaceae bacterium]